VIYERHGSEIGENRREIGKSRREGGETEKGGEGGVTVGTPP
jgi:hypothetical protein